MPSGETIDASAFADDARGLLEAISESRGDLAGVPGGLDGALHPCRGRVGRAPREGVEGQAAPTAARRRARSRPAEGEEAGLLRGAEGVEEARQDRGTCGGG